MNCHRNTFFPVLLIVAALAGSGCRDSSDSAAAARQTVLVPLKQGEVPDTSDLQESFSYTIEQALKGDPESMFQVGWAYVDERMPQVENPGKAVRWFMFAAERGHVTAQFNVGSIYAQGRGVAKDEKLGAVWLLKAAQQGEPDAQFSVGLLYEYGRGLPKDELKAFEWHLKAARNGVALAQTNIGSMYRTGQGVNKDPSQGAAWYEKAAEQGEPGSQYGLGTMYLTGEGVPQDNAKAYIWLTLSQPWYPNDTEKPLKELRRKLTKKQLAEAQRFIDDFDYNHPRYVVPKRQE